jgi:hypothetical protein
VPAKTSSKSLRSSKTKRARSGSSDGSTTSSRKSGSTSGSPSGKRENSSGSKAAVAPKRQTKPSTTSDGSSPATILDSSSWRGRLPLSSSPLPQVLDQCVVKLRHGWYAGFFTHVDPTLLHDSPVGPHYKCRVQINDDLYPKGDPWEPPDAYYECLAWGEQSMWELLAQVTRMMRTHASTHLMMQRAEKLGVEHIVGVAIRRKGVVYRLGWPARHHTILHMLCQTLGVEEDLGEHDQGFWTSVDERYVSRQEAAVIARAAGQTVSTRSRLFSEDLW